MTRSDSRSPRTVIIADDHAIVRNAVADIVTGLTDTRVVAEAANGIEAIALCRAKRPALLSLDSAMPGAAGMEVLGDVRRWSPETRICLLTGVTARGHLAQWHAAGVDGIAFKTCPPRDIQACFAALLEGGTQVTPAVQAALSQTPPAPALTPRERQVLHLLVRGHANPDIAARLSISPKTVDNHRTRLMAKLGVHSLAELLAHALREGLLDS